eukprot:gene40557-49444_t
MTFSTINQLFAVAKSLAAQSKITNDYDENVVVTSNGHESSFECEYGDAQTVVVYCPYESVPGFLAMLVLWCVYFFCYMIVRVRASYDYSTNDLRFYLAIDQCNGTTLNVVFVAMGALLTFISVCVTLFYMTPQTRWNPNVDSISLLNLIIFVGINVASLWNLLKISTVHNLEVNRDILVDLPSPLYLTNVNSFASVFRSSEAILKSLLIACVVCVGEGQDLVLEKFGDAERLRQVMLKLYQRPS